MATNTSRVAPPSPSLLVALRGSSGVGSGAAGPDLRAKAAGGGSHGAATGPLVRATDAGVPVAAAAAGWSRLRVKVVGGVSHDGRRGRELEREQAGVEEAAGGGNCSGVDLRTGGRRGWKRTGGDVSHHRRLVAGTGGDGRRPHHRRFMYEPAVMMDITADPNGHYGHLLWTRR